MSIEDVRKRASKYSGDTQQTWSGEELQDVVLAMFEEYHKPAEEPPCKCDKPKIKLEAGCRVSRTRGDALGVVVHVGRDGTVCVNRDHPVDGYNRICAIHATNLTVTEAATPEKGDSVRVDSDTGFLHRAALIEDISELNPGRYYLVGNRTESGWGNWYSRDDFTITHKAKP